MEAAGITDTAAFRAAYEVLGAQRNTKILGIFTRLWKRDGKAGYLTFQPRVWGYLERNLALPAHVDRKSVVVGKRVSVRVSLGGGRITKKKKDEDILKGIV